MYFIGRDDVVESFSVSFTKVNTRIHFDFSGDHLFGKGIAVPDHNDGLRVFINEADRREIAVKDPGIAIEKCDESYICLPLSQEEASQRLAKSGIKVLAKER